MNDNRLHLEAGLRDIGLDLRRRNVPLEGVALTEELCRIAWRIARHSKVTDDRAVLKCQQQRWDRMVGDFTSVRATRGSEEPCDQSNNWALNFAVTDVLREISIGATEEKRNRNLAMFWDAIEALEDSRLSLRKIAAHYSVSHTAVASNRDAYLQKLTYKLAPLIVRTRQRLATRFLKDAA